MLSRCWLLILSFRRFCRATLTESSPDSGRKEVAERLSEAQRSELALFVARGHQVLEDLASTRCESEPVRKRAAALQDEIIAWLTANADAGATDMFKSITGVPGVLSGLAPQHVPLYQRFRGRMKVLQQLARTYGQA